MKTTSILIIIITFTLLQGCGSRPVLILETEPESAEILINEISLGITPIELDKGDLKRFNLPQYERVETSPTTHWCTWDIGQEKGRIYVAHPSAPEERNTLVFNMQGHGNRNIPVLGHSTGGQVGGANEHTVITFNLAPNFEGVTEE